MDDTRVEVHGFDELADGTAKLAGKIEDITPERFERIAELAVSAVRSKVPHRSGAMAASVRSGRRKKAVLVRMGKARTPYAGWIDFGGKRRGRGGGIATRPYVKQGRYLYPTALAMEPQLIRIANETAKDEIGDMRWPKPTTT